jgi:hypothetical protein
MLRNFDTDLDQPTTKVETSTVQVIDRVEVVPRPTAQVARTDVLVADEEWAWQHLRDYVVHEIEARFGPFPHDSIKEASIFKAFLSRHGKRSAAIARHAFEVCEGRWAGAPISVNRFAKNSDPYFAEVIAARLVDQPVTGW